MRAVVIPICALAIVLAGCSQRTADFSSQPLTDNQRAVVMQAVESLRQTFNSDQTCDAIWAAYAPQHNQYRERWLDDCAHVRAAAGEWRHFTFRSGDAQLAGHWIDITGVAEMSGGNRPMNFGFSLNDHDAKLSIWSLPADGFEFIPNRGPGLQDAPRQPGRVSNS